MKNLLYVISLFALISCHSEAQKTVVDYAETITQEELKTHGDEYVFFGDQHNEIYRQLNLGLISKESNLPCYWS